MAKTPDQPHHKGRIIHIKGTPAETIGYVDAPDADTAMERAIAKFNISPRLAGKLVAEKIRTHPKR
jgi:hypothetical protein